MNNLNASIFFIFKKQFLIILVCMFFVGCSTSKRIVTTNSTSVIKPTHIQPDTCLTDKQFREYLKFVKDSMKIEARNRKVEIKFDTKAFSDSLNIIRKMYERNAKEETKRQKSNSVVEKAKIKEDGKTNRVEIKQESKTDRTQLKQEGRTNRSKSNWWVWLLIGHVLMIVEWNGIKLVIRVIKRSVKLTHRF